MVYMMLILRKNNSLLSSSSYSSESSSLYFLPRNRISSTFPYFLHFSSAAAAAAAAASETPDPQPSNFIVEYLINSCGFSRQRAAAASKRISHVTSPTQPDSVTHFLKHHGFDDAQVLTLVSRYPPILCTDTGRTLEPNLAALRETDLAEDDLRRLVLCNPQALLIRSAVPRIEFWRTFLNGDKKKLLLAFTRNRGLINLDVHRRVFPRIALLKDYGLSESDIGLLVVRGHCFINRNTAAIKSLMKQVEDFGFHRGSPMFVFGLTSFSGISSDTFKAKMEIYRSFGWSQEDLVSAVLKAPLIIRFSEESIRAKVEFLVETAGCTQKYIALHPNLLGYSLEKRLVPRIQLMKILKSKGLFPRKQDLYSIIHLTEEDFLETVVHPYKDTEPALFEAYFAACAGKLVDWTARRVIS